MATSSDDSNPRPTPPRTGSGSSKSKLKKAIVRGQTASAAVRRHADIQMGTTADKVPGFDPAAAPMETDAEAGGASTLTYPGAPTVPESIPATGANASNHGDAMRPFPADPQEGHSRLQFVFFAVMAIIIILGMSAFLLLGL